jgi:hypothetical protein
MQAKRYRTISTLLIVSAFFFLSGGGVAQAALVIHDGSNASRIENLDIDGIFYDVDFVFKSAVDVYGNPPVFDFTAISSPSAFRARDSVIDALNHDATVPIHTVGPIGGVNLDLYYIGYDLIVPDKWLVAKAQYYSTTGLWGMGNPHIDVNEGNLPALYADFSQVPVPGAVWLLGTGLIACCAAMRRRKK